MSLPIRTRFSRPLVTLALGAAFAFGPAACASAQVNPGKSSFEKKCASCHGADGEGVAAAHEEPLQGDLSIAELASVIERTMPEDHPENCVGDESRQIAVYIHEAFYSPQARHQKRLAAAPRIGLSRLTVPQYRNAVADLIGHFTPSPNRKSGRRRPRDDGSLTAPRRGMRAEYFQSDGMNKTDTLQQQRIDHRIDFDFGESSPAKNITADQFVIVWECALVADDTGHYEFRVRTQNGARLYVNSEQTRQRYKLRDDGTEAGQTAIVDAWVSSGEMRECTGRVFLLGGRRYPLRLEFFKYLEEAASIKLEWKPPHGTWSVLDHNHSIAAPVARVFVADTPFPADDRSLGYERGSSVSREWQDAIARAAVATAAEVVERLQLLAQFDDNSLYRQPRIRAFLAHFASVAFRRPLTSAEDRLFREDLFAGASSPEAAVRRAIPLILNSPHFLYTDLTPAGQAPSQHAIASRLSFALLDSIPDEPLLDAASSGQLATKKQIEAEARRMMASPRARAKMRGFFHHWLELDERDLAKDKETFPEFDEAIIADLRTSLELFVEQVVWSERSDYRQLLLADYLVLNERLRGLYRPEPQDDSTDPGPLADAGPAVQPLSDFRRVAFSPNRRAGVLTHPYLLSAFAYHNSTSPIHRGVFLARNIVGRSLKPPPVAVAFKNDQFAPDLTMREKVTQLTRDEACMSCHSIINPLGFALENFDAVGRWRTSDNHQPVDAKSEYTTAEGSSLEIRNARDIANFAVASESAGRAFVTQVFHHLVKQSPFAYGADVVDQLYSEFADDSFNIQHLWVRIAAFSAAHGHLPSPEPESER